MWREDQKYQSHLMNPNTAQVEHMKQQNLRDIHLWNDIQDLFQHKNTWINTIIDTFFNMLQSNMPVVAEVFYYDVLNPMSPTGDDDDDEHELDATSITNNHHHPRKN